MTEIYHPIKERKISVRNLALKSHVTPDKRGKYGPQKYVTFTVIGNNREHEDFLLLEDFKEHNPSTHLR